MEKNELLRDTLAAFVAEEKEKKNKGQSYTTQSAIGVAMGYSNGSIISQYLGAKPFPGNLALFEERLAGYLGFEATAVDFAEKPGRLQLIDTRSYAPTSVSEQIYKAIEYCRLMKGISILHGDAGVGKTMAARQYVKSNKGAAIYLKVQEGRTNRREIIVAITEALGVKDARNPAERYQKIREKLHKARKVLIFDEAHRFPLQTLEFIRDLAEDEEDESGSMLDGAGIVLIGNTKVVKFIRNFKREDMEQFRNRMIWDGRYLRQNTTLDDVKLVFPYLAENGMNKELEMLWKISAQQVWGLRGAVNTYNNAVNAGDVSYDGLLKACTTSNIGIR